MKINRKIRKTKENKGKIKKINSHPHHTHTHTTSPRHLKFAMYWRGKVEFSPIVSFNHTSTVVWYVFCGGERRESYCILYNCCFLSSNSFILSGNLQVLFFLPCPVPSFTLEKKMMLQVSRPCRWWCTSWTWWSTWPTKRCVVCCPASPWRTCCSSCWPLLSR